MTITWNQVLARYPELDKLPNINATQGEVTAMGEAYIHGRLGAKYSVPFSSNNMTARDLMVDAVYVQQNMTRKPEVAKALLEFLDARIESLLSGEASMTTDTGTVAVQMVGDAIWSSTMDYHPTFGMGSILDSVIDSSQIIAENDAKGFHDRSNY